MGSLGRGEGGVVSRFTLATPDLAPGFRRSLHESRQTSDGGLAASVSLIAQVPSESPAGQTLAILSGFPDGTFELC